MSARLLAQGPASTPSEQLGTGHPALAILEQRAEAAFGQKRLGTEPNESRRTTAARAPLSPARGIRIMPTPRRDRLIGFVVEQRWQGYVAEVSEKLFHAVLFDNEGNDVEAVELEKEEVNELMRHLIKPGA